VANVTLHEWAQSVRRAFLGSEQEPPVAELERPLVLCADDDESVRVLCASTLGRAGYSVDTATNGREALEKIDQNDYAAVLLDLSMPYIHGTTVLSVIGKTKPELLKRTAIITGAPDAAIDPLYGTVGAVLRKPLSLDSIATIVRHCVESHSPIGAPEGGDGSTVRLR
jgi:DNA-binding NtrC family response regulator